MTISQAKRKAIRKYDKEHYNNIQAPIKKEYYTAINNYCKLYNISKASLIVKAIFYIIENNIDMNNYEIKQEVIEELLNNED